MLPESLTTYFQNPEKLMEMILPLLGNVIFALLIFIVGRWVVKRIMRIVDRMMEARNIDVTLREFLSAILSISLTFVVALAALAKLGVNITSLLTLLGAAGLAIGLALQNSLSNFAAGIMLILFRPFKADDYVEAAGIQGIAETISIFSTTFRTADNKTIIVPNKLIYDGSITNYTQRQRRRVDLVIGISYGDDIKLARKIALELMEADERVLDDPAPLVAVGELGEYSVDLLIRPWTRTDDYWELRWDLLERIKETFEKNGISIPFPRRDLVIMGEDASTRPLRQS